jgi:hypothetical protein
MLAKKAVYEDGTITFPDRRLPKGKMAVIVTFLQDDAPADSDSDARQTFIDKWAGILAGSNIDDWRESRLEYLRNKHT